MGSLERVALYERRKGYVQHAVLSAVGISGILLVTMAAPNALQLLGKFGIAKRFNDKSYAALTRLKRNGLITFEKRGGKNYACITADGKRVLALEERKAALLLNSKKRWDKRFRLVMFDVPERRRKTRVRLREVMRGAGFLRIQDSVWAYPYDCEDFVALLKADLEIGKDVIYAIVESMGNDTWIRNYFHLPHRT